MRVVRLVAVSVGTACLAASPLAPLRRASGAPGEVEWRTSLTKAFEEAKREGKPVFVAINAERVDGGRVEPAARELREGTYRHALVVAKAKEFVPVLLRDPIDSENGGELRSRFAIDGQIVSPQHLFAYADGTQIFKKEYWEFSYDPAVSVAELVKLMDRALEAHRKRAGITGAPAAGNAPGPASGPPPPPDPTPAPPGAPAPPAAAEAGRTEWILATVDRVRSLPDLGLREAAAKELVQHDREGDCVRPLCTCLLETREQKKQEEVQVMLLRVLGRPGLEVAADTIAAFLEAKDPSVRGNAAVSLEYVGSKGSVDALSKRLPREKDEAAHGNVCRALGRCGAGQDPVRKALLREVGSAKSDALAAAPIVALAYFEGDADAARALEKLVKKEGFGLKRGVLLWALAEVGDAKSEAFVRQELMANERNPMSLGVMGAAADHLRDRTTESKAKIDEGLRRALEWSGVVWDEARRGRDDAGFRPKGDFPGLTARADRMRPGG